MLRRTIQDGKLCLVGELIGGPADGLLCKPNVDRVFIVARTPVIPQSVEKIDGPPSFDTHVYEKISEERYEYRGR
jgi:hypothetical protein